MRCPKNAGNSSNVSWSTVVPPSDPLLPHACVDLILLPRDHPNAGYNLVNAPYLVPAYLLDEAIVSFSEDCHAAGRRGFGVFLADRNDLCMASCIAPVPVRATTCTRTHKQERQSQHENNTHTRTRTRTAHTVPTGRRLESEEAVDEVLAKLKNEVIPGLALWEFYVLPVEKLLDRFRSMPAGRGRGSAPPYALRASDMRVCAWTDAESPRPVVAVFVFLHTPPPFFAPLSPLLTTRNGIRPAEALSLAERVERLRSTMVRRAWARDGMEISLSAARALFSSEHVLRQALNAINLPIYEKLNAQMVTRKKGEGGGRGL